MKRSPSPCRCASLLSIAAGALAALAVATGGVVLASDPPHWLGATSTTDCTTPCHVTHNAQGGNLTSDAGNTNLCQSCHDSTGLPISNSDIATPGTSGSSHAFGVSTIHATFETQDPLNNEMLLRVMDGNVVCSTCHDQHAAKKEFGGTPRVSAANKVQFATPPGSGSLTSGGTYTGDFGYWYLIEIDGQGSEADATFRWSKDNGTSWMATGVGAGGGVPVALGADGVEVTFSGLAADAFKVGEQWEFYASWPFLRAKLDQGDITLGDKFCRDCHRSWVMTHDSVGGTREYDGQQKSHPVGVALNANSRDYDRATPLDANGGEQGVSGDGLSRNDLALDGSGFVQCLTCHGVHYADSNSLTDGP
jgi:predicted CXXCH cytochrome family protein